MTSTTLNPVSPKARFVAEDGTLTDYALKLLQTLAVRFGGALGDTGDDVFAPLVQDSQIAPLAPTFVGESALPLDSVSQPFQPAQAWPIGSIFTSVVSTSPADLLGYGTWSALGGGFLAGYQAGDLDFGTPGGTGGVKSITIDDHASHTHQVTSNVTTTPATVQSGAGATVVGSGTNNTVTSNTENPTPLSHKSGGVSPIKTLPPYLTVYIWKRTA